MKVFLLAFFTCFMFFNPGISNEIFPYWIFLIFLHRKITKSNYYIFFGIFLIFIANLIYFNFNIKFLTDSLQIFSVIIGCFLYSELSETKKEKFNSYIRKFIILNSILMILQLIFPSLLSISANYFAGRDSGLIYSALARNNAVLGFAPEPSYGSALISGLFFLVNKDEIKIDLSFFSYIISIILFKSIYGFSISIILFIFFSMTKKIDRRYVIGTILIGLIPIIYLIRKENDYRFIEFISGLINNTSIFEAEKLVSKDSTRLDFFRNFNILNYSKNYENSISVFVYFIQTLKTLWVLSIPIIIYLSKRKELLMNLFIIIFLLIVTPKLIWPLFMVSISLLEFKKISLEKIFN